ncbi:hypothetical protein PIB30_075659 [Stylosanthes scabra]|uniref:Uncharacterized protein n=1 Tax=Stylosanthes scabra TaxID=79078 RepID=A0ABU6SQ91_9FABA|nr:hypothetical protein [Stylosanthes scabra]
MESDGAASNPKQNAGGGRSERSSSTQGIYDPRVGKERDEVAPKCHYGVYTILYLSKTTRTLIACNATVGKFGEEKEDVKEHFTRIEVKNRVSDLENKAATMENIVKGRTWSSDVAGMM